MHGRSERTSTGVVHYEGLPPSPPECRPDLPSRPLSASTSTPDRPSGSGTFVARRAVHRNREPHGVPIIVTNRLGRCQKLMAGS